MSDKQLSECLFPSSTSKPVYKMPDYAYVHKELQRSGVTLNLLWLEYCGQRRAAGEIPYQSTQFNKYYADYLAKVNATIHLNHKPGEVMQVDWAGDAAAVIDTDTGEIIPAYVFVATLPYSGYSYVEAFFSMNQEAWTTAHVNAYKYFGGVTRIIQCDNLKTGVQKHGKDEVVLNKSYQELAEHYGTVILPARVRAPKDKAALEGSVGIISTFILAAIILLGATGSGKTYLACALGMAAVRRFYAVKYIRLPDLLVEFQIVRGNGTIRKLMAQYKKYALLIIDEWLLYPLKETEARDLLEIVESRYKRNSTIFCSQFDIPGWPEKLSDPLLADASCDRIVHDSYTVVIGGKESMRKRKGLQDI